MAERGGGVRMKVDKAPTRKALVKFVKDNTDTSGKYPQMVMTDERAGYKALRGGQSGYIHRTVNHSEYEWVRGIAHTNTVEGVFSLFKRSVVGAYHSVSAKHLPAYLDEFAFRFNRRTSKQLFEDTVRHLATADPMTFAKLTRE